MGESASTAEEDLLLKNFFAEVSEIECENEVNSGVSLVFLLVVAIQQREAGNARQFWVIVLICSQVCDASILLDDSNGNARRQSKDDIQPNLTLKGFDIIDIIKEDLEAACPGTVSCFDILVLATRYAAVLIYKQNGETYGFDYLEDEILKRYIRDYEQLGVDLTLEKYIICPKC